MKKIVSITLVLVVFALMSFSVFSQTGAIQASEAIELNKDETIYASLDYDGSIKSINVVNHIITSKNGTYIDFGKYSDIVNLTNQLKPKLDGNKITWQLSASDSGFYYKGILQNAELPFNLSMIYLIDGKNTAAKDLIGKSGKFEIVLKIISNNNANKYFKENYICQVQVPLSLDKCTNIAAQGAQNLVVGRTATLAYMVLPGKSKDFKITFDAKNFEAEAITATVLPFDAGSLLEFDTEKIKSDIGNVSKGTKELIDGTQQLKDGVTQLADGIKTASDGAVALKGGTDQLKSGIENYTEGVGQISSNANLISAGLSELSESGTQLVAGYEQLAGGIEKLLDGFSPLLNNLPPEQQVAYLKQLAAMKEQIGGYGESLEAYKTALNQTSEGMSALSGGLTSISQGNAALVSGASGVNAGAAELSAGMNKLKTGSSSILPEIQKLIDGQKLLGEGIEKSVDLFKEFDISTKSMSNTVSFVDSDHTVSSVQFVMKTQELKPLSNNAILQDNQKKKSLWLRFKSLFIKNTNIE